MRLERKGDILNGNDASWFIVEKEFNRPNGVVAHENGFLLPMITGNIMKVVSRCWKREKLLRRNKVQWNFKIKVGRGLRKKMNTIDRNGHIW